jgi:hypothetical protein
MEPAFIVTLAVALTATLAAPAAAREWWGKPGVLDRVFDRKIEPHSCILISDAHSPAAEYEFFSNTDEPLSGQPDLFHLGDKVVVTYSWHGTRQHQDFFRSKETCEADLKAKAASNPLDPYR